MLIADRPAWTAAKSAGDAGEIQVAAALESLGLFTTKASGLVVDEYDVTSYGTIEVKTDLLAETTGNVAVEVSHRGQPSGIETSKASGWAFVIGASIYFMPTGSLRKLIKSKYFRRVRAGEGAECFLVPIDDLRGIARVLPSKPSENP